jgi:predicted DNA-binding transcriptional regulator AlpA
MAIPKPPLKTLIYCITQLEQVTGLNRQRLRRLWTSKRFPQPTLINSRCMWKASIVHSWINENLGEV